MPTREYSITILTMTGLHGGVLIDVAKIVDSCANSRSQNVQPAPSSHAKHREMLGLAFDKITPYDYLFDCDTTAVTLNSPRECRWHNCHLPSHISSNTRNTQQTVAIYVR